jgi:hypothetical protein
LFAFALFQDVQQDDVADRYDGEANSADNDDSNSISSGCDSKDTFEGYEDNFQVGINIDLNNSFDQLSSRPDSRIGLVIESY